MNNIVEPLRAARILREPKKFPPLRSFSCGRGGNRWEKLVNDWARNLYLGIETHQTVVVVEDANGKLIGVCSFKREPVPVRGGKFISNAHRVHMLGTDRLFHGKRLKDGSRPGDALLRGVLEHIKAACEGSMPFVWTLVSLENDRSRALFQRHGFREAPYVGGQEIIHVRPSHKRLPVVGLRRPAIDRSRMTRRVASKARRSQESEQRPRSAGF